MARRANAKAAMPLAAPPSPWEKDYASIANQYAQDVVDGKIPACWLVKAACARQLKDLENSKLAVYVYRFDPALASRPCAFIEMLPHTKGDWAARSERIKLEPWQVFQIACLFGWVRKDNGKRRFTEYYGEIPRKNSKSTMAAGVGLYMLTMDGEFGAEVYSGASTEKQAWEVFRPAKLMVQRTPELADAFGMSAFAKSIVCAGDGGRFEPLIGKPGDGSSPHCAIVDEFHEHDTSDLIDTMQTGMGARRQPLTFIITTAGYNISGPCYDKRAQAVAMLEGNVENDQLFACIYTIDLDDDWTNPEILKKANPNYGVSVMEDYLLAKQREAILNTTQQNRFKTKHLNVWCSAKAALFNLQLWQLAGDRDLKISELEGEDCWFAVDLASKVDICAYIKLFRRVNDGLPHFYCFGRYYLPEEGIHDAGINAPAYMRWAKQGLLKLTEGATVDFETVHDEVAADIEVYKPKEVVYDPYNAMAFAQSLMDLGPDIVEFIQTPQNFAIPIDELQAAMKDGRFHHNGDPMLSWMIANCVGRVARKGLLAPTREKPENKIDGAVALAMAMARATVPEDAGLAEWLNAGTSKETA
jgi:phage terminase large subunit-like protein